MRAIIKQFFALTLQWWKGATAKTAWWLSFALTLSLIVNVGINFAVNRWNKHFFDALEMKNASLATQLAFTYMGLVLCAAAIGVCIVLSRETLQVRWREWLVQTLLDKWVLTHKYHQLQVNGNEPANPEYRIADDTRMALEPIVDFAIGFISALFSALTFVGVLWVVGGSYTIWGVTIPAFMVFAALLYAVIMSSLMVFIGKRLPGDVAKRNETEAKFRFELTRLRENAKTIFEKGQSIQKREELREHYNNVALRWLAVVRRNGHVTWIANGNGVFVPVFPLLLAAPKYFDGSLSLGEVTQLAGAFFQTQIAVAWLVDNFRFVAQCYASIIRVTELQSSLEET